MLCRLFSWSLLLFYFLLTFYGIPNEENSRRLIFVSNIFNIPELSDCFKKMFLFTLKTSYWAEKQKQKRNASFDCEDKRDNTMSVEAMWSIQHKQAQTVRRSKVVKNVSIRKKDHMWYQYQLNIKVDIPKYVHVGHFDSNFFLWVA